MSYATKKKVWHNSTSDQRLYLKISEALAIVSQRPLDVAIKHQLNPVDHHLDDIKAMHHKLIEINQRACHQLCEFINSTAK